MNILIYIIIILLLDSLSPSRSNVTKRRLTVLSLEGLGGGGGVLLGFFVGIVSPGSPNPKPISDQSLSFSLPVYRPGHLHLKVVNCGTLLGEGGECSLL